MMKTIAKSLALAAVGAPQSPSCRTSTHASLCERPTRLTHARSARAVGTASAGCKEDCEATIAPFGLTCGIGAMASDACTPTADGEDFTCTACPDGCQAEIDKVYAACGGCEDFDTESAPSVKAGVEAWGCAGAAHATPAFFVAVAAIANHFLN